ncbi:hypothetical protein GCM10023216_16970 [Isoptericola chiayiensis]|uniref:TPM domain-containing protein n=1 Tax=Isoptericola chiayiensis TaxID=579446 RepID=A0ABP8YF76_9MICO|nr:hypothetical protein [Isoptericola chiayiensis]NOV99925.1 hypothetical protein [Isoptericola chiayiensis]
MDGALIVGVVTGALLVVVAAVAVVAWAVRRRRTRRERATEAELERLGTAAGSALVRVDERARLAEDEVAFAEAELGAQAAADVTPRLRRAREHLREAFHLNQLLHDSVPDTEAERRTWSDRILEQCRAAETLLGEADEALRARRRSARETPALVDEVEARATEVAARIAPARELLTELGERYAPQALRPVADNPDQAERLLDFARRSARAARRRLDAQQVGEAGATAHAAEESVRRAEGLLAAVGDFEAEALRAEAALGDMIAESRAELAEARALPAARRAGAVDDAVAALQEALDALPAPGEPGDPVGSLSRVRQANTALDDAVRERTEADARRRRASARLAPALDDAERQVAAARSVVDDYRAPVGPDARTRLAEAERELSAARTTEDPERAVDTARRAASLAAEASTLAHRDVVRSHPGQHWGARHGGAGPRPGGGMGGSGAFGAVLGGMVLGGILDDIGDLGDMFD